MVGLPDGGTKREVEGVGQVVGVVVGEKGAPQEPGDRSVGKSRLTGAEQIRIHTVDERSGADQIALLPGEIADRTRRHGGERSAEITDTGLASTGEQFRVVRHGQVQVQGQPLSSGHDALTHVRRHHRCSVAGESCAEVTVCVGGRQVSHEVLARLGTRVAVVQVGPAVRTGVVEFAHGRVVRPGDAVAPGEDEQGVRHQEDAALEEALGGAVLPAVDELEGVEEDAHLRAGAPARQPLQVPGQQVGEEGQRLVVGIRLDQFGEELAFRQEPAGTHPVPDGAVGEQRHALRQSGQTTHFGDE